MKYTPKTKPFRHQARATLRAVKARNFAFFMEPRCGKTKAALDTIAILAFKGEVKRVLVLGPLSTLPVWEDQIREHFPLAGSVKVVGERPWQIREHDRPRGPRRLFAGPGGGSPSGQGELVEDGGRPRRNRIDTPRVAFFLCNYDKVSLRSRKGKRWVHPWVKAIESWQPDLVVCDEAHCLKRPSSNRSRQVWRLVSRMREGSLESRLGLPARPYVHLLSGTPNPKGYRDLFAQYRVMDAEVFGTAISDYDANYVDFGLGRNRFRIVRYRNKQDLLRRIKAHAFIITRDKALDMPPEAWVKLPVILPQKARRLYDDMAEEFLAEFGSNADGSAVVTIDAATAATVRLRLRQITGGFTTDGTPIHGAKVAAARDFAASFFEQGRHLVVYAAFLPETEALEEILDSVGFHTQLIVGATPKHVRADAIRSFGTRSTTDALVFQVATGSLGIDLSAASDVLFYSLPDAWDVYFQGYSRVLGPAQKSKVTYYHLVARGTVDVAMLRALRAKGSLHAEMMGNQKGFLYGL